MKKNMPKGSTYVPRKSKYRLTVRRSSAGLGLFTEDHIQREKFIIEYYGPLLTRQKADEKGGKYLFEINSRKVVEGSPRYNIARYINHSCRPNCETDIVKGKIYVYAKRAIKPGEELAYDYGKEYFDDFIKSHGCNCIKCKEVKEVITNTTLPPQACRKRYIVRHIEIIEATKYMPHTRIFPLSAWSLHARVCDRLSDSI